MGGPTYSFHRCLGRGGFGEVYLATRHGTEGLDQRVAVKVLRPDLPHADTALKRLRDEGRMLAALAHPAIVGVLELTRLRGRIALVTEYVEGADLARFCVRPRLLPARVVLSVGGEVAGALDTAWNTPSPGTGKPLNLVHRDIKPENVRLSIHGAVKVLDFGIARSTELAREARTATGNLPFTPGYTAPEAFVAMHQGAPSDVFALGATLYRLLVGERFYEGVRLPEQAALSTAPDRYRDYLAQRLGRLPEVGLALSPLLRGALAYVPEERPNAAELQHQCEALADLLPGVTGRRWARDAEWPEEREVQGAALTGLTLTEDRPGDSEMFVRPRPPAVAPSPGPAAERPVPSAPPPIPAGLVPVHPAFAEFSIERVTAHGGAPRAMGASGSRFSWAAGAAVVAAGLVAVALGAVVMVAGGVWMAWGVP